MTNPYTSNPNDWARDHAEPEIDWEAKFHKAVSTNVRQADNHKRKTAQTLLDLQEANRKIRELEAQLQKEQPLRAKLKAAQDGRTEADQKWNDRCQELVRENRALKTEKSRGQRAVIEGVITWLHGSIARMPEPTPEERIQ